MEPHIDLLARLRSLLDRTPDFKQYPPTSVDHLEWLGRAHALVSHWNQTEAITLKNAMDLLGLDATRDSNVNTILAVLYRALADLELKSELKLPADPG